MGRIGYARVRTTDQDLAEQIAQLEAAGCGIILSEAVSGASRDGRDELATILTFIGRGDELVVQRIDRLGRSTRDVLNIVHELDAKGASLRVLDPEVTTAGELGRIAVTVLGMVAGMELRFIKGRQKAGIEAAKARGAYTGGRKTIDDDAVRALIDQGLRKAEVARRLGISRMTVYRTLQDQPAPKAVVDPEPVPITGISPSQEPVPSADLAPHAVPKTTLPAVVPAPLPSSAPSAPATPEPAPDAPFSVRLVLTLAVEINRKGTRGRKRAIADIEAELAWQGDLDDDPPVDGDYALTVEIDPDDHAYARQFCDGDALDYVVEELIRDLGRIADQRYCFVQVGVAEPATGRSWAGVEPPKAERRRRPPRQQQRASKRRRRSSRPEQFVSLDRWGAILYAAPPPPLPCVIRKGQGADTVYYVDADDRQSAWHPDKAKAKRFESDRDADYVLGLLVEHGLLNEADDDFDVIKLGPLDRNGRTPSESP